MKTLVHRAPGIVRDRIFTLLDIQTQLSVVRLVCKSWCRLVDQVIPFRVILNEETFKDVRKFGKKHKVGELVVGFFSQPYPDSESKWPFFDFTPESLTIIESPSVLPEAKLERLFNEFRLVQQVSVASRALIDVKRDSFLRSLELPNLRCLRLLVECQYGLNHGLSAIQDILSQTYPCVTMISVSITCDDDLILYADLYSFASRHPLSKSFQFYVNTSQNESMHDRNSNEVTSSLCSQSDQGLEPIIYADVLQSLGQVMLTTADMYILTSEGRGRNNLGLKLLITQTTLTTLHLNNIRNENMAVWRTVPAILRQCSCTLNSIVLDGCFCSGQSSDRPGPFWCHWVEDCHSLERLEILICGIKVVDIPVIPKEKLKCLCLGQQLSQRQMRTICDNFLELEELSWPQMDSKTDVYGNTIVNIDIETAVSFSRVVTIFQFKRACSLPKLKTLRVSTKSCKLKSIRKFIGPLMGIYENVLGSIAISKSKRGDLEYTFDRTLFFYPGDK